MGALRVVIDGQHHELPDGDTVLQALRRAGIDLPALCHDDRVAPSGACRACVVQISGLPRPVPACATALRDGMEILTNTPELTAFRRFVLTCLAARYPAEAVRGFPHKAFHRYLDAYGLPGAADITPGERQDSSHPLIRVDMSRCIDCYRCVRICDELQGQRVWHVRLRGNETRIEPDGPTLRDSTCVSCGACVDTCPTGALEDAAAVDGARPGLWTRTTCAYCGTGCELSVGTLDGRIIAVRPANEAPVNKGHLCVKGRYGYSFVSAADRITDPLIRAETGWMRVTWSEALAFTADRLRAIIQRSGPDSVGILGSARATNEDNYLTQKFARLVVGTNNVDCCARVCHAPSAAALKGMTGAGLATGSFDDIELARTILVCGANPTENHPIVGARIRQAARRGAHLIVIDPRQTELALEADIHLAPKPGTNVPLLNAMAHVIVSDGLVDEAFIAGRVDEYDEFVKFIERWPPSRAAAVCGVDAQAVRDAARMYASGGPCTTFHGLGVTEHVQGTDAVMLLVDLALLTGNIGKPGAGVNPLRGQNNVQGSAHMGCDPRSLPGSVPLDSGRAECARLWGQALPATRGLNLMEMLDAATAGQLKALWAIGYDVLLTNPNASWTKRALAGLDLVIVQDLFFTETAREHGTVFLPACSSFEKDGTFMNAERRIQRVRKALEPVGRSLPDWKIVCEAARALGHARGFTFERPEEIWNEVRALCEGARGMSYARLDAGGLQWPCPSEDHPGTIRLHADAFGGSGRAALRRIDWSPTEEQPTPRFPLILVTGRTLYQFNAGTMAGRPPLAELHPADVLDVSPEDAGRLGLHEGDQTRLTSAYGEAVLPVRESPMVRPGEVFATFHTASAFLNAVTGPHRDGTTGTPEYKVTAVRLDGMRAPGGPSA